MKKTLFSLLLLTVISISCKKDKTPPVGTVGKIVVYQGVSYKWDFCSSTNLCSPPDNACHCFYYDVNRWTTHVDDACVRAGAGSKPQ